MTKKKKALQPKSTEPESTKPELETAPEIQNAAEQAAEEPNSEGGRDLNLHIKPTKSTRTLQTTEKLHRSRNQRQGTTILAAEKLNVEEDGGFNPRVKPIESTLALVPEGRSSPISPETQSFPAEAGLEAENADEQAEAAPQDGSQPDDDSEPEFTPKPRPPAKLERLQKILAAAGVASRRSAEALIEQGRVQVNGKVVTVLGTKADAGRDHIRVDGKLLQGAERHRYFVLNKPRGFVTTVKDPEGRPTVMQFFDKMKERLYPVGRLDYMSEGLLVVTNDGDLANRLTKASTGVEKTYLVKVAGQPTEGELNILRGGIAIERGKAGSPAVRTSPARIRQVRQGDNPWYEVVLIEGRNRELRKMFEEVGHFVEKIRRTGYGPLVLDQEPGSMRELEPGEVELLRKAAEGKLRTPKAKELRRRNAADAGLLPTVLPKPSSRPRLQKPYEAKPPAQPPAALGRITEFRPKKFGAERPSRPAGSYSKSAGKPMRPDRASAEGFRPAAGRTSSPNPVRSFSHTEEEAPRRTGAGGPANFGSARPAGRSFDRPAYDRPATGRTFSGKPAWKKPERPERAARPEYKRPAPPRREAGARAARDFGADRGPVRPPNLHIEEIHAERPSQSRPFQPRTSAPRSSSPRPPSSRPNAPRPYSGRPASDRPRPNRPRPSRPSFERPAPSARPGAAKPFRGEGGLARPFTTSNGKPRAGGARPSSKPGSSRPFTPRAESASSYRPTQAKPYPKSASRAERKPGPGWRPKPSFGGAGKPASGAHSKPKPGGFSKSGYKAKPGGAKRTGPRPGGKPGGKKGW
jgi:23S rRNA pseudouridine2605 synthase